MKFKHLALSVLASGMLFGMTACPGGDDGKKVDFDFTVKLESGKTTIDISDDFSDRIVPIRNAENSVIKDAEGNVYDEPSYKFTCSVPAACEINNDGYVKGIEANKGVTFTVTEQHTRKVRKITNIAIDYPYELANGGFNYASASGAEAIETRTEVLGKLEKYAMDTHLTGITLFENGGYVKYNPRIELPTEGEYVVGYGFGILSEGRIKPDKVANIKDTTKYQSYYHSASASDPLNINAMNAKGSEVADLAGYISSAYWGTRLSKDEEGYGYEWYPVLAKDKVNGKDYLRPTPVTFKNGVASAEGETGFEKNPADLYRGWRIYVKTGDDGITFRHSGKHTEFENKKVTIADYEFAFRALLTGSHGQSRGAEMAGDTTYGIKGAQKYFNETKNSSDAGAKELWNKYKADGTLGIQTGTDANGSYIQLELVNAIDNFTAMYTLSSNLYSPLSEEFIEKIGNGSVKAGMKKYGAFNNASGETNDIRDYTLCCGAYYIDEWVKRSMIVFTRNDEWFERKANVNRYQIPGVKITVISGASEDPEAIWKEFVNGGDGTGEDGHLPGLDSAGIPTLQIAGQQGKPNVYQTKGDSTFKLNVNSCTSERWDELFGPSGTIVPTSADKKWDVKPWMSNDNFLRGLFHSINREEFATKRGVQPSINYFSDAYLADPENGISYNSTDAHKEAVRSYQTTKVNEKGEVVDAYGYSYDKAVTYFRNAVNELVSEGKLDRGTESEPTKIHIHIRWMYQTDTTEYGEDIKAYFERAFNDEAVSGGTVQLVVDQDAVTNWEDVYDVYMMKGQFDLGFGAISGNTYNPLNFLEVLKSDNSSGFTLNWGADTSKVDANHPLIYNEKKWSYDSLWEVADHGGVVKEGSIVKPLENCYIEHSWKSSEDKDNSLIYEGGRFILKVDFVDVTEGVEFELTGVSISGLNVAGSDLTFTKNADGTYLVVISSEFGAQFNSDLFNNNDELAKKDNPTEDDKHPFVLDNYGLYWELQISYTISINGGTPTENYMAIYKNSEAQPAKKVFKLCY